MLFHGPHTCKFSSMSDFVEEVSECNAADLLAEEEDKEEEGELSGFVCGVPTK